MRTTGITWKPCRNDRDFVGMMGSHGNDGDHMGMTEMTYMSTGVETTSFSYLLPE